MDKRVDIINELNERVELIKRGKRISPPILDIHPVNGCCNLNCKWCIGQNKSKIKSNMEDNFTIGNLEIVLEKIFDPKYEKYWPLEVHICGCDSEPLIKKKEVLYLINYLKAKNVTTELITNGLLINELDYKELIKLDKLSISFDCVNENDFYLYKVNNKNVNSLNNVAKLCRTINEIDIMRKELNSNLSIYTTFIATEKNFNYLEWKSFFIKLKSAGVNHIQVRSDICKVLGDVEDIDMEIRKIAEELNANSVSYDKKFSFDIKYHSPNISEEQSLFLNCYSSNLWPSIGMDLKLYNCAHTTLNVFQWNTNLLNLKNYYEEYCFGKKFFEVNSIGCNGICPPTLRRMNIKSNI